MPMNPINEQFAARLEQGSIRIPAITEIVAQVRALDDLTLTSPVPALRDAVLAGDTTAESITGAVMDAAATLTTQSNAREITAELWWPFNQRFGQAVAANADTIIEALRQYFDAAAGDLTAAVAVIRPDMTADDVVNSNSPDIMSAWNTLPRTTEALDAIAEIVATMSREYGVGHAGPRVLSFVERVVNARHLQRADALFRGVESPTGVIPAVDGHWRRLVDNGFQLRLNTASEAAQMWAEVSKADDNRRRGARVVAV